PPETTGSLAALSGGHHQTDDMPVLIRRPMLARSSRTGDPVVLFRAPTRTITGETAAAIIPVRGYRTNELPHFCLWAFAICRRLPRICFSSMLLGAPSSW